MGIDVKKICGKNFWVILKNQAGTISARCRYLLLNACFVMPLEKLVKFGYGKKSNIDIK